jgi:hypothetical protein
MTIRIVKKKIMSMSKNFVSETVHLFITLCIRRAKNLLFLAKPNLCTGVDNLLLAFTSSTTRGRSCFAFLCKRVWRSRRDRFQYPKTIVCRCFRENFLGTRSFQSCQRKGGPQEWPPCFSCVSCDSAVGGRVISRRRLVPAVMRAKKLPDAGLKFNSGLYRNRAYCF